MSSSVFANIERSGQNESIRYTIVPSTGQPETGTLSSSGDNPRWPSATAGVSTSEALISAVVGGDGTAWTIRTWRTQATPISWQMADELAPPGTRYARPAVAASDDLLVVFEHWHGSGSSLLFSRASASPPQLEFDDPASLSDGHGLSWREHSLPAVALNASNQGLAAWIGRRDDDRYCLLASGYDDNNSFLATSDPTHAITIDMLPPHVKVEQLYVRINGTTAYVHLTEHKDTQLVTHEWPLSLPTGAPAGPRQTVIHNGANQ